MATPTTKPTTKPTPSKRPKLRSHVKAGKAVGITFFDASHGGAGAGEAK